MPNYSVKDQYCDPDTGNWLERVYPGGTDCHVSWINSWWYPIHMEFARDSCVQGFKLDYCLMGQCRPNDSKDKEEIDGLDIQDLGDGVLAY